MHDAISCGPVAPVNCSTCACVHTVRASSASRSISTTMPTPRSGGVAPRRYQAMPAPGAACRRGCSAVRRRQHRLVRNRDVIGAHDNIANLDARMWLGDVSNRIARPAASLVAGHAERFEDCAPSQRIERSANDGGRDTVVTREGRMRRMRTISPREVRHADVQRRIACAAARDSGIPDHIAGRATAVTGRKLAALRSRLAGQG